MTEKRKGVPKRIYEFLAQQIVEDYGITEGRCLDVGAGRGQIGLEVALRSSLFMFMLDIKEESLAEAETISKELGLQSRTATIKAPVEQIPFLDDYFDIVISRGSINFWDDRARGLKEIFRVLKPGGLAFLGGGASRLLPQDELEEFQAWAKESHRNIRPDWEQRSSREQLIEDIENAGIPDYNLITGYGMYIEFRK
ncbi:MAG: class I SAM-dependent methyltransferase [Dehalococcoidales bacterium]|nr:class I SAM-dependent methyltransferase [Dehalococcoidales bacterium]